ncbi:hypothetical protein CEUSTIGMA_g2194.t1 [Chlamydomonas eustigma]|uniref:RING-type domain-containing protein n=1 Tax=Chlamydomonas eustigma TaxID=1157962 RepID=A0A250WV85_9CHLO|nr:hypothetical protein CEUSTIGMA_g2194.t1 [Chlamydomonas eustigma]|eukprot:GAX74747.1 hypothetical protein CEUSTIGMA_g2194.t1 [Chlamydomonas eustigma]
MSEFSRSSLNEDDEDLPSCTVCLHSYDNGWHRPYDIGCGHCLCQRCYVKWTGRKLCPACRKEWHNPHVSFDFLGAIDIIKAKQRELRQAVPGHTSTSHIHDNHACEEQSSVSLIVKLRERQRALRAAESATWAGRIRHKLGLSGLAEAEMSLREVVHHAALSYNVPSWAVTLAKTLGPGALLLMLALAWRYVYAVALLVIPMVVAAAAYVDHEDVADAEHVDSNQVVQVVVPHEQQRVRSESFTEESDEESEDVEGQQVGRGTQGREENPEREVVMDGARAGNRMEHTSTLSSTETDVDLQLRDAGIAQGGVQNANESGSHQHLVLARDFDEDYNLNEFEDEDDADLLELRFQAAAELGLYEDDLDVEYVEGAEHNSHDLDVEDVEGAEHNNHDSKLLPMFPEHASQHVDSSDSDALSKAALVREQESTLPDGLMREQAALAEGTLCEDMDARTRADGGTAGVNDSGDEQQAGSERKRSSVEGGTMLREDVQGVGVDHHEEDRRAWGCGSDLDDGKRIGLSVKKSHGEEEDSEPRGFDQLGMLQSALHLHAKRAQQFQHVMRLHEASLEGFQTLRARLNGLAAEVEGSVNLSEGLLSVSSELAGPSSASLERFASSYRQCQSVKRVEASGTMDCLSGLPITHPALLQTLQDLADSEDKELLHLIQNFRRSYESAPHTNSKLPATQPPPEGSGSAMHGRDMSQTPHLNPWGKAHEQMELTVAVSSKTVEASGVHSADVPAVATERDVATASTSLLSSEAGGFVFKAIANCQSAAAATVPSASSVELVASSASSFTPSAVDNCSYCSRDPHKITSLMGEAEAQNKTHSSSLQTEVSTTNHQNVSTAAPSTSTLLPAFTASLPAGPVTLTSTVDPPQPKPSPASPILASQQPLTEGNQILSAGVSTMLSHATSPILRIRSSTDLTAEVVSSEALAARQDGDDSNAAPELGDSTRVSITESSLQQQSLAEHSEGTLPLPRAPLPAQPNQQASGGNQTGRMFTLALLLTCIPSMLIAFFTLWHHMVLQRVLMWLMLGGLLLRISEGIWQQLVGRPATLHHPSAAAALQSRGSSWFTLLPTLSTHRSTHRDVGGG